jgi:oxygen-independent coproporphyrinogen-3 oxidase
LTRIRTIWGVSVDNIKDSFGAVKAIYFQQNIEKYIAQGLVKQQSGIYTLTENGMFVSDDIMANLMFI